MLEKDNMIAEIMRLYALKDALEEKWMELSSNIMNLSEEQKIQIKLVKELRDSYMTGAINYNRGE